MNRARGFSLVELMVAITMAMIITAGMLSVFVASRSAFQATSGTAALSDNGRFALSFLESAVRDAGNMACGSAVRTIVNVNPEPTSLYYAVGPGPLLQFQPMSGFEAVGTGVGSTYAASKTAGTLASWNPPSGWPAGLDAAFNSLATRPVQRNDIIVVRSSTQGGQTRLCHRGRCQQLDPRERADRLGRTAVGHRFRLRQIVGLSNQCDWRYDDFSQYRRLARKSLEHFPATITFAAGSLVTALETTAYYIGVGADGDGALFSADLAANNTFTPNELVPDIEAMQILYGLDTNQTQTVAEYVTADQIADFTSVMSVEIAVLAAGPVGSAQMATVGKPYNLFGTIVTAPIDSRMRQVFEVTIAARNSLP